MLERYSLDVGMVPFVWESKPGTPKSATTPASARRCSATGTAWSDGPGLEHWRWLQGAWRRPRPGASATAASAWSVDLGLDRRPQRGASGMATMILTAALTWSIGDGSLGLGLERRRRQPRPWPGAATAPRRRRQLHGVGLGSGPNGPRSRLGYFFIFKNRFFVAAVVR
jgi:hypothetical protein